MFESREATHISFLSSVTQNPNINGKDPMLLKTASQINQKSEVDGID
jgi:hypothetical protein